MKAGKETEEVLEIFPGAAPPALPMQPEKHLVGDGQVLFACRLVLSKRPKGKWVNGLTARYTCNFDQQGRGVTRRCQWTAPLGPEYAACVPARKQ